MVEGGCLAPRLQEVHVTGPKVEGMRPSVDAALVWLATQVRRQASLSGVPMYKVQIHK